MDDQIMMMNDDSNGSARATPEDVDAATTAALAIAPLDERVMVQEFMLAHLVKRRDLLSKQRQGMERKLLSLKTESKNLLFKERTLELAQTQQIALQSEVKAVMHKNRDKIRLVLMEHAQEEGDATNVAVVNSGTLAEATTIDEIMDVANKVLEVQQHHEPPCGASVAETTRNLRDKQVDGNDQMSIESGTSDDDDRDNERAGDDSTRDDEGAASLEADSPSMKNRKKRKKMQTLKEQLSSTSSTLVSATIHGNPFTHGKAGIASLFAGINAQNNHQKQVHLDTSLCSTQLHLLVSGKRLEQIMELIVLDQAAMDQLYPEDGRHRRAALYYTCCCLMRPAWDQQLDNGNGAKITTTRVDRPATDEDDETNDSFTMDPNTSLCPYELAGECADPFCPFQHLKPRTVESQTLILELLPLPVLSLVPSLLENRTDQKATSTTLSPTSKEEEVQEEKTEEETESEDVIEAEPESKRQKVLHGTLIATEGRTDIYELPPEEGEGNEVTAAPLDFDDDFLSLPAANDDNSEDDDEDSGEEQIPILWWMTGNDRERVRKQQLQQPLASVDDWLQIVFAVVMNADCTTLIYDCSLGPNPSGNDLIRQVGRLVDALQFVLHAGRYDYGAALCEVLAQIESKLWWMLKDFFETTLPLQWKTVNRLQNKNVYSVAFEQQLLLSCISEVFRFMSQHDDSVITGKKGILSDLLHRIVSLPLKAVDSQSRGTTFLRKVKNEYPDLLTLGVAVVEMEMKWNPCEQSETDEGKDSKVMSTLDDLQNLAQSCSGRMSTFQAIAKIGFFATAAVQQLMASNEGKSSAEKNASRLESKLENICSWIDEPFNQPYLRMTLAPILAVRVSLLISLRRYDKAQRALERYLVVRVLAFSDLLWSQLVTLRSNLPCRRKDVNASPSGGVTTQLPQIITRLGVKLNHLSLVGDRNLFQPFLNCLPCHPSKQKIKKWRATLKTEILFFLSRATKLRISEDSVSGATMPDMKVDLHSMPICVAKYPGKMLSLERVAFPRTLMLGGSYLKYLQLDGCRIEELPPTFGNYFPNLQELAINKNRLTQLPSSFRNLTALVRLDASENKLTALPADSIGECVNLEYLNVSHNQLMSLPNKDMRSCSKLILLDLSYNQFQGVPNDLILHIDSLVFLEMKGNPCCASAAGNNKNHHKS